MTSPVEPPEGGAWIALGHFWFNEIRTIASKYVKPGGGIPESDLNQAARDKLNSIAPAPPSTDAGSLTGTLSPNRLGENSIPLGKLNENVATATQLQQGLSEKASIVTLTQAAYDALSTKVPTTLYIVQA